MDQYVKFLQVGDGDSIRIRWKDNNGFYHNIFFDLGSKGYYDSILKEIESLKEPEKIDLLMISHIDNDHIYGAIDLINDQTINLGETVLEWWFNYNSNLKIPVISSPNLKEEEGEELSSFLNKNQFNQNKTAIIKGIVKPFHDAVITVLSPNEVGINLLKEKTSPNLASNDESPPFRDYHKEIEELAAEKDKEYTKSYHIKRPFNISSIAFLFESVGGTKFLFLADSSPHVIIEAIDELKKSNSSYINNKGKLEVDYMQVSHHGSKFNTTYELLNKISCTNFIISTDGSKDNHPHKETLSRIIDPLGKRSRDMSKKIRFYFNHDNSIIGRIFLNDETAMDKYNFECYYTEYQFLIK